MAVVRTVALLRHTITLLALGLAPACTTDDGPETVYDPCSPLTIAIASDLGAAEVQGVDEALAAWAHVLPTQIEIARGASGAGVLPIEFVSGAFFRAIYWDSSGRIEINRDRLAPEHYGVAIAHELGHAFGLMHIAPDTRSSVMNVGNVEVGPTEIDAAEVAMQWQTCGATP